MVYAPSPSLLVIHRDGTEARGQLFGNGPARMTGFFALRWAFLELGRGHLPFGADCRPTYVGMTAGRWVARLH